MRLFVRRFEVLFAALVFFAIQIYCDFSGYSDMAIATAALLGFELRRNFAFPYFATSITDFWRRWHISLSSWLRDYLYIPLGGNRRGLARTRANLMITMLLGGLWHGAAWNFVVWGAWHGTLLVLHRAWAPALARWAPAGGAAARAWHLLCIGVVFQLVCLGWLFFRASSLGQIGQLLGCLVQPWELGVALTWLAPLALLTAPLLLMQLAEWRTGEREPVGLLPWPLRSAVYGMLFATLVVLGEDGGKPFVYFQF